MTSAFHPASAPVILTTETRHDGPLPARLLNHIHDHVIEYGLPVTRGPHGLDLMRGDARVAIHAVDDRFDVRITAPTEVMLHQARESVIYLLDHVMPDISGRLAWTGPAPASHRPPNFHLATVRSTDRVGAHFIRVHMACDDVAALCVGGMHFSLLLPPGGRAPVWPMLNDRMRTVWPADADALHRAPYTFVTRDPAQGTFSFDIFIHDGGRTTTWAQSLVGGEVVGVMGPGSGDHPVTDDLLIAGDETALPAIRSILEQAPRHLRGRAVIEVGDPADIVALAMPSGMSLDWIVRGPDSDLWSWLRRVDSLLPDTFVWIAAEQATIRQAKAHFKALGLTRDRSYISYYWTRQL
ncbi:NADPH-dependent ferric siderophore reductase, contains FAD-binding and SIP domains [Loktanella atrilutea]|uniref:NADPH-dependent ferric siderophore reductase, contains FAD-binding and SIP domains n=1 Tax=Loktanella atrilutea TaxID=366533 RepID=A0A1M4XJR4_LOKAT|nr:siderophore-interacting protein [Loktanella atrilutea]SHE93636.1 NADPH-dependent ferric siderophore reductase, contains FAD-binding and SIP domains [Loktanella atrilutea]